ncbi:hypothetical protein [Parerythrobacter lacustris]|uniref:Lipoprotein n=1 Tax=Parerythrobacter lacustris TaxID=2969984 RepID=A0ABT1XP01_9SPHN|nr:hypothetical protein [Parerythrobacter lacustris]MCR2833390.1 hypothetical protein [Parerythrobacter lacustris]
MSRRLLLIAALPLAACGQQASEQAPTEVAATPAPAAAAPQAETAQGAWSLKDEGILTAVTFAGADSEPRLTLRCDRVNKQVIVEMAGTVQPGEEYSIIAGGQRFILPMVAAPSELPTMTAQVSPQQPILGSMAAAGTSFTLVGPTLDKLLDFPATPDIRRVIDVCSTV